MDNVKNYIFFAIYCFLNPRLFKLVFHRVYIPVYVQYEWLKDYNIKTIIDVGACYGRDSRVLNYLFPKAMIYAFEPIKENCQLIKANFFPKNLVLENIALSNKPGKAAFYKNYYLPGSSLLPLEQKFKKKYKFLSKTERIEVKTTTLDNYFKNREIKEDVFLKIDVQGAENLVLKGGKNFLKRVSIIHIEVLFDRLYKGQGFFEEIYNYLTKLGFRYLGEIPGSEFYPSFELRDGVNSIFINSNKKPKKYEKS